MDLNYTKENQKVGYYLLSLVQQGQPGIVVLLFITQETTSRWSSIQYTYS